MRTVVNIHGLLYRIETTSNENGGFNKVVKFKGDTIKETENSSERDYHLLVRRQAKKMGFTLTNECSTIN